MSQNPSQKRRKKGGKKALTDKYYEDIVHAMHFLFPFLKGLIIPIFSWTLEIE